MQPKQITLNVNNVPTLVQTWGLSIDEITEENCIILMFPGSPGICQFYDVFLSEIYETTKLPVWIVCHAGHNLSNDPAMPSLTNSPDLFNLDGQIEHKAAFIRTYIPSTTKIILIGHSLGSLIIVKLLNIFAHQIEHCHLICPVLEHFAYSKRGLFLRKNYNVLKLFLMFFYYISKCIPSFVMKFLILVYNYFNKEPLDNCIKIAIKELMNVNVINNVIHLLKDEIDFINELDYKIFENFQNMINCYYCYHDYYVPKWQREWIAYAFPKLKIKVLDKDITHAFIVRSAKRVAAEINKNIQIKIQI